MFSKVLPAEEINQDDIAQAAIKMLDYGQLDNDPELKKNAAELNRFISKAAEGQSSNGCSKRKGRNTGRSTKNL